MSTYQWQNIVDAWRKSTSTSGGNRELSFLYGKDLTQDSPSFLLPFSPNIDRWTDEHYGVYSILELVLGNRKEVTPEEREELSKAKEIDSLIESGDPDWLSKVEEYFNEGYNIDEIPITKEFVDNINKS